MAEGDEAVACWGPGRDVVCELVFGGLDGLGGVAQVVLCVGVGVNDVVSIRLESSESAACFVAFKVGTAEVGGIEAEDVEVGVFEKHELSGLHGGGDVVEGWVVPGVVCDLVTFEVHAADEVGPWLRSITDGLAGEVGASDEESCRGFSGGEDVEELSCVGPWAVVKGQSYDTGSGTGLDDLP